MWNQITDYLKAPLNTIGRVFNPHSTRSIEERNQFEAWKAELAAALSTRTVDSSALVALGRRGFSPEFRFWVKQIFEKSFFTICRLGDTF